MPTRRTAILGFAHGHVGSYCGQWRANPAWGVEVVAGYDHDDERAAKAAGDHGVDVTTNLDDVLKRDDVDAVVIGAETSLHAELVERAAGAGKAIVLQKPLALTLDEADRIIAAVDKARVPFTLAWQMRVDPQNLEMKRLLEAGELGRVYMVRRRHGLSTHVWGEWFENSWHVDPKLNRGMWADDAAHAIDFLLWLLGEPVSVTAEIATLRTEKVPDDNGIAIYRYADGTFAEVCSSFVCVAGENTTEIVCDRGVIIQNFGDAPSAAAPRDPGAAGLKWIKHGDKAWTKSDTPSPTSQGERIAALAKPLADFLHGRREAIATASEGRAALKMTLACYDAASHGCRVSL